MYNIGLVGSDSSHADAFSQMINLPDKKTGNYRFPDFRVSSIFGIDRKRTEEVARSAAIDYIADKPEQIMDKADAVMVVFRHGDLHAKYALPFIEAGIPIWIDKPFTIKNEDAKKLIETAKKSNTLLSGGSSLKHIYDVRILRNAAASGSRIGRVKSATINFPATIENEYGGIYFYGSHLAEMTMAIFGYEARSVTASENNGNVAAIVKYDDYQVIMNFTQGMKQYFAVLYGEEHVILREFDITGSYVKAFEKFAKMITTKELTEPLDNLYAPVSLLNAVVESYQTKTEVVI